MKHKSNIMEKARMGKSLILNATKGEGMAKNHNLILPILDHEVDKYNKYSPNYSPNSVFKLEMLMLPDIQDLFIEVLSLLPLRNMPSSDKQEWDALGVSDDCLMKLGKYGFKDFINRIQDTVSVKCKHHNGKCVLMNKHSYSKIMEVVYTMYCTDTSRTDVVMNLASGNTYWANVWIANHCKKLYTNDNGFYLPIHIKTEQNYNYNEYQNGIESKIVFNDFDASDIFPYPDNMFDKIVSHSSVEHIDNWEINVLPEIIRTLKPGGKCGLASAYHPLGRENMGRGQSSWWTNKKWNRFVGLQAVLGFEIIGNNNYIYGLPWRSEEDTDSYRFGGSIYIANFIFFQKSNGLTYE